MNSRSVGRASHDNKILPRLYASLLLPLVSCFFAGSTPLQAQEPLSQDEIASHLMTWVPPIYPAIAQAAQIQGEVVLNTEIAPDGLVRSTKPISGPAMLRQATSDAVKQWRYRPFRKGNETVAVTGNVLVSFSLQNKPTVHTPNEAAASGSYSVNITVGPPDNRGQPDEEIADRFEPMWDACTRGVIAHAVNIQTAEACKKAAAIADEFPADRRYIERRHSYVYAAVSFANLRNFKTALLYADKAVDVVKLGHDDSSGSEAAYSIRGQIRAFLGDMGGSDEDMSVAEKFARKGKNSTSLRRDLQFHADLLNRMNQPQEAQAKRDEASKL